MNEIGEEYQTTNTSLNRHSFIKGNELAFYKPRSKLTSNMHELLCAYTSPIP